MSDTYLTKRMYILGEATCGPTNEPVQIINLQQCISIFGNSKLTQAWNEAYQVEQDAIEYYGVRINGIEAMLDIWAYDENYRRYKAFTLKCYYSGSLWNNTNVYITEKSLKISNPAVVGGYIEMEFEKYVTVGKMAEAINAAFREGYINTTAIAKKYFMPSTDILRYYEHLLNAPIYFIGGEDEVNFNKNRLHELLEVTYNIIEGQSIDVLVVADAYFDDVSPIAYYNDTEYGKLFYTRNRDYLDLPHESIVGKPATFHGQLINFCKTQLSHAIITHGVMALCPVENVEDFVSQSAYATKVASATCLNDGHDIIDKELGIDNGKFISIVTGDFLYTDIQGQNYYNNGYAGYAAMLTEMNNPKSLTNNKVPNISKLRYYLDDDEALLLSKLGVVSFRWSALVNALVVTNGVTAALNTSPYHVVSNMRMVQLIMCAFKNRMDSFIGENLTKLIASDAMQKAADSLIKMILETEIVKDLKATVTISATGAALIDLQILARYSLEYVKTQAIIKL